MKHEPALDGVRGLAVLLVLQLHFNPRNGWAFPFEENSRLAARIHGISNTGWIGVDLFFVLSGYLITRGLVAPSHDALKTRLWKFWARRSLRIFPLYYTVLLVGTFVALFWKRGILPSGWYWLYLQNYSQAFEKGELSWTGHLWSLAVEEQFYLVWPLTVLVMPTRVRPWMTLAFVIAACVIRIALLRMSPWDPDTTVAFLYRATFTRVDGLLLGAFAAQAAALPDHPLARAFRKSRTVLMIGSMAALALLYLRTGLNPFDPQMISFGYPLLALSFTTIVAAPPNVFAWRPLRAAGKVSYGMYLLHWPVVVFAWPQLVRWQSRFGAISGLVFVGMLISIASLATYAVALLVYKKFEIPFLRLKERFVDE